MAGAAASILQKRAKELKEKFVEKGAVSSETALTLADLGVEKRLAFELLILKKHIVEIENKYYFDVEKFDDRMVKKFHDFVHGLFEDLND